MPVGHALTRLGRDVTLDDLLDQVFVVYRRKEGPGIFDTIVPTFAAVGATIRVGSEVTRLLAAINLVAAGRGISIVPATHEHGSPRKRRLSAARPGNDAAVAAVPRPSPELRARDRPQFRGHHARAHAVIP